MQLFLTNSIFFFALFQCFHSVSNPSPVPICSSLLTSCIVFTPESTCFPLVLGVCVCMCVCENFYSKSVTSKGQCNRMQKEINQTQRHCYLLFAVAVEELHA